MHHVPHPKNEAKAPNTISKTMQKRITEKILEVLVDC